MRFSHQTAEKLREAKVSEDELTILTGSELLELIGPEAMVEVAEVLQREGKGITRRQGEARQGRLAEKRHLDMLRLRVVDGLTFDEVGRSAVHEDGRVGMTGGRVSELLDIYFGVNKEKARRNRERDPFRRQWMVERAVVLQVLRDDHAPLWTRDELKKEIPDFPPDEVNGAIDDLAAACVVEADGDRVSASLAARRLDKLELISV
jgi:hypothetical protein